LLYFVSSFQIDLWITYRDKKVVGVFYCVFVPLTLVQTFVHTGSLEAFSPAYLWRWLYQLQDWPTWYPELGWPHRSTGQSCTDSLEQTQKPFGLPSESGSQADGERSLALA
jgi:hypothetical protein